MRPGLCVSWACPGILVSSGGNWASSTVTLKPLHSCSSVPHVVVHSVDTAEREDINTKLFNRFGIH